MFRVQLMPTRQLYNSTEFVDLRDLGMTRLIDINEVKKFTSRRAHVANFQNSVVDNLLLDVEIVIVNVRSAKVLRDRESIGRCILRTGDYRSRIENRYARLNYGIATRIHVQRRIQS